MALHIIFRETMAGVVAHSAAALTHAAHADNNATCAPLAKTSYGMKWDASYKIVILALLIPMLLLSSTSTADHLPSKWQFISHDSNCSISTDVTTEQYGNYSTEASVSLSIYYDSQTADNKCNTGSTQNMVTVSVIPGLGGDIQADTHAQLQSLTLLNELAPVQHQGSDCSIRTIYTWNHRVTGLLLDALKNAEDIKLTAHLSDFGILEGHISTHGFPGAYTQLKACISELHDMS